MKTYALLLLFGLSLSAQAVDNYDPNTGTLVIPSVSVGDTNFNNVTLRLNNFEVLGFTQAPSVGVVIYEDALIRINMKGSSRSQPSFGDMRTVTFSLVITNKATTRIGIAAANISASTLSDEKGETCSSGNLGISGINAAYDPNDINTYVIINGGGSKIIGVRNYLFCGFTGNSFSFYSSLEVYDEATQTVKQIPFNFVDLAIPN